MTRRTSRPTGCWLKSYGSLSKHQIAQASELLQAQMLQPININPVPLQITDTNLGILQGAARRARPTTSSTPFSTATKSACRQAACGASRTPMAMRSRSMPSTTRYSMSLGPALLQDRRIPQQQRPEEGKLQCLCPGEPVHTRRASRPSSRYTDERYGDRPLRFNPDLTDETFRSTRIHEIRQTRSSSLLHAGIRRSRLAESIGTEASESSFADPVFNYSVPEKQDWYMGELQYLFRSDRFRAIAGGGYSKLNGEGTL